MLKLCSSVKARSFPLLFIAATAAPMTAIETSLAADPPLPTEEVGVRDLDLTKPEDVQEFDARIRRAARDVCLPHPRTTGRLSDVTYHRCVGDAVKKAAEKRDQLIRRAEEENLRSSGCLLSASK